jgi:hypothetical protein
MNDPALTAQLQTLIAQFQQTPGTVNRKERQITRRKFTPEDDDLLRNLVTQHGSTDWSVIAQNFQDRTARQCRDRWRHYVSPEVLTGSWTKADEETLLAKVQEIGPRWATIAQIFPGRTDIGVKNHYISITGKKNKEFPLGSGPGPVGQLFPDGKDETAP